MTRAPITELTARTPLPVGCTFTALVELVAIELEAALSSPVSSAARRSIPIPVSLTTVCWAVYGAIDGIEGSEMAVELPELVPSITQKYFFSATHSPLSPVVPITRHLSPGLPGVSE